MRKPIVIIGISLLFLPMLLLAVKQEQDKRSKAASTPDLIATIDKNTVIGTSKLEVGGTNMQYMIDPSSDPAAASRAKDLVRNGYKYMNQHIIGFGSNDINPTPGVYDWTRLDRRIDLAIETGKTPVITLCCAPSWMKGAPATFGEYLDDAPLPAYIDAFADLTKRVAQRYNGVNHPKVEYFLVWNEMKGMYSELPGCSPTACGKKRWDYERYTTLYNAVYDQVKAVRPDAKIGGPYVRIKATTKSDPSSVKGPYGTIMQQRLDVINYWLANKRGADFIVVDGGINNDENSIYTDIFSGTQLFADANTWMRSKTSLPIWWAEDYVHAISGDPGSVSPSVQPAALAMMLSQHTISGASVSLRWSPEAQGGQNEQNLFTNTRQIGGGQPYPNYSVYKYFYDHFKPGTNLLKVTQNATSAAILASPAKTLLINKKNVSLSINLNEQMLVLNPYEVRVIDTPTLPTTTSILSVTPSPTLPLTPTPLPGFRASDKGVQWTIGNWYNKAIPNNYDLTGMKSDLDMMQAAGINWIKFTLHKGTGTGLYDQLLPELNKRNIKWLANVSNPNKNSAGKIIAGNDTQRQEYQTWLGSMVDRYKDQGLKYYEIWNEPNLSYFWNINHNANLSDPVQLAAYKAAVADYVTHLQDAYSTIKAHDPEAQVLLGGLSQWKYEAYVDELIALQAERYFDIFAFHPYGNNPTTSLTHVKNLKARLAKSPAMAAKPLWLTEYGYTTVAGEAGFMGTGTTEQTKATYLVTSMNLFRAEGIQFPMIWYNLNGDNPGTPTTGTGYELVHTNFLTRQQTVMPAYIAYKNLWLTGISPTIQPTTSPTQPSSTTKLSLNLFLHGIGTAGDNVTPGSPGTLNPLHPTRNVTVELFDKQNQLAFTRTGTVTYNASSGDFRGTVDLGSLASDIFTVKITVPNYLRKLAPGIVTITGGQLNTLPPVSLIAGDINNDNGTNVLDFALLLDCFSDISPARNCSDQTKKQAADLTDDGNVNQFDYNLFLREISVHYGQ